MPGCAVQAPLIEECFANFECTLVDSTLIKKYSLFVFEVGNAGNGRVGLAAMIDAGMVSKMICSFPRSSDPRAFTERYLAGTIDLELVPQGTLAERIRAGGAGIPALYTPTAYGTELARGKVIAEFDGRPYVQERIGKMS